MAKSKLCEAAYDGDLDQVRALLKKKAGRIDGKDGDLFDDDVEGCVKGAPYYLPLTEAARAGHADVVEALLEARADLDGVDYRSETALIHAATSGHLAVVELLLDKGADKDHVGCLGTALMRAAGQGHGVIVEVLLEAGADPSVSDGDGDTVIDSLRFDAEKLKSDDPRTRTFAEDQLRVVRALDRRWGSDKPGVLATWLAAAASAAGAAAATTDARDAESEALLNAAAEPGWDEKILALLPDELEDEQSFRAVERLCKSVLADPRAMANDAWGDVVTRVLGLSWSYEDVTMASYGEALTLKEMDDDEGGAMDWYADEHLYTFDLCLALLTEQAAAARDDWADLVETVCEEKRRMVGYMSFGDTEVKALFDKSWVLDHSARDRLKPIARKAFPYAGL
jgi:hypothetical protein